MNLQSAKEILQKNSIYHSEGIILHKPSVIGYEKKFRWRWFATQMNTFIVITDFGEEEITPSLLQHHLKESFDLAQKKYSGWPRGFQSGIGVISILISSQIHEEAKEYCRKLKSGKKWAGFSIPVAYNPETE